MKKNIFGTSLFLILLLVSGCFKKRIYMLPNYAHNQKPITIFIHGTLPPLIDKLIHMVDVPLGLTPATVLDKKFLLQRIPSIVSKADPEQFPIDTFYLFGWSGDLSFEARAQAAWELYKAIKDFSGPITIIGHSHGGNVALELASYAEKYPQQLIIERLVLLACPIQSATAEFAQAPLFKKVFSLYALEDMLQILDPQGLYSETKKRSKSAVVGDLFSQRTLPLYGNVVQAQILMHKQNPWHISFMLPKFLKQLPAVLDVLAGIPSGTMSTVNIPDHGKPYIVKSE